ncbi:radical SAM protein [Methanoplanus sp. FWC-SCC4]|uniref:Radical SAM protein n=1 Tax=Methanochimaera problematica TaxID=2609417 RepID=A0AA97FBH9_9EURY|nr:radical SAM protein [Methanoplanus sp. FWC-SCC4]WOF16355.1 radical SAM protein [Methanoplanus sp. FWC-SCC4]
MAFYTKDEREKYYGYYLLYEKISDLSLKKKVLVGCNLATKKIDEKFNRTNLLFRPTAIQIEPTTKCNLKCKFCLSPVWERKGKDMDIGDFKKIIDQFPFLVNVLLQGVGEPLMCKDFFKMIEYCHHKKIKVGTVTNGTLLDNETVKKILDSKIEWLAISIDGSKPETFENIRIGANFNQVISNVSNLIKMRGNSKIPRIPIHFVGNINNMNELPGVVRLAKNIGADGVDIVGINSWGGQYENVKSINQTEKLKQDVAEKYLNEASALANEIGITFDAVGKDGGYMWYQNENIKKNPIHCQFIFKSCFITVEGHVTPCTNWTDRDNIAFGNILKEDFNSIWNSQKIIELRDSYIRGEIPEPCRDCTEPHLVR